ncbi:MAG: TIGR01244 family phosphatase [Proteobacteria bacterium]|nr:TIGR01244 family phosphatase [Pseudomonadota bacterium]
MPAQFRKVTDDFWVAGQIDVEDVRRAAEQGIRLIVNNRPDGEGPGQTPGAEIEAAAKALGLAYVTSPVRGRPSPEQALEVHDAIANADGPALAYCLSGMRSIVLWAYGEAMAGARGREELVGLARNAGYDLSMVL